MEIRPFINPVDCLSAAMSWLFQHYYTQVGYNPRGAPGTFEGYKCVDIYGGQLGPEVLIKFVCFGLQAGEQIPGAYALTPGEWDTYVNGGLTPEVPLSAFEQIWEWYMSDKTAILTDWVSGDFYEEGYILNGFLGQRIYCFDTTITYTSGTTTISIRNQWWINYGDQIFGETITRVEGMVPAAQLRQPSPVYSNFGTDQIVKALQDIAQRTTVAQINNRGAIADLASGDIITPGGTDVPE